MTAMWMVVTPTEVLTPERITNARRQLCSKIRRMNPPVALIRSAVNNWISQWRRNDVIRRHMLLLHWFPLQLSAGASDDFITSVHRVCVGGDDEAHIDILDDQLVALREIKEGEDLATVWRALSENELTAFFTTLSFNNTKYETNIVKAMFCMVETTTKTSFSDQWLQSRWSNIQADNPLLMEVDAVEKEVLGLYENFF